jgi:hypothetical protein
MSPVLSIIPAPHKIRSGYPEVFKTLDSRADLPAGRQVCTGITAKEWPAVYKQTLLNLLTFPILSVIPAKAGIQASPTDRHINPSIPDCVPLSAEASMLFPTS